MTIPNTHIIYGKLKENDLENFTKAWIELGLPIYGKNLQVSVESINEANKKLNEWPIKPDPYTNPDNKLIFSPVYHPDGNLYIHAKIHLGNSDLEINQEIQSKYNKLIREYFLKK